MTTFLPRPPLVKAVTFAADDVKHRIKPADLAWLHAHPVTWIQALGTLRRQTEDQLAKSRLSLAVGKPTDGMAASSEYLQAKALVDADGLRKRHFLSLVKRRYEEVVSLLDYESTRYVSDATLVARIQEVEILLEAGDSDQAADVLALLLDGIEGTLLRLASAS
jgi:hypothetical protein